jgi:hypothetical protein
MSPPNWQEQISRVGFFTSAASYVAFWLADAVRPGFVARYVSVHLFLLAAVAFGAWWALVVRSYRDRPFAQYALAALLGAISASIAWNLGDGFEEYRFLAVIAALAIPAVVVGVVRGSG